MEKIPSARYGGKLSRRRAVIPSLSESNGHCIGAFEKDYQVVVYDTKVLTHYKLDPFCSKSAKALILGLHNWESLLSQADRLLEGNITLDLGCNTKGKLQQILIQRVTSENMLSWRVRDIFRSMPGDGTQPGEIISSWEEIRAFTDSVKLGDYRLTHQYC